MGGYLGAIGIKTKLRTMERAAFYSALATKKLKGLCVCVNAVFGNASSRIAETVPKSGVYAYGAFPETEELYARQAIELDPAKRQAMLHDIQRILHEKRRFAPIFDYVWASGLGPRMEDPSLRRIAFYPWSAPLEDVRMRKP